MLTLFIAGLMAIVCAIFVMAREKKLDIYMMLLICLGVLMIIGSVIFYLTF